MFSRTKKLIGQEGIDILGQKKVLVIGVGGVGGYVVEMLARAGIGHIAIMDFDKVDISNINRQIIALHSTIGKSKVEVLKERIKDINPNCEVEAIDRRFCIENSDILDNNWDYVVDAIDSFDNKVDLICLAKQKGLNIISATGAGNRNVFCDFEICDIYKTSYDGLAKKLRKALKEKGVDKLDVCYTKVQPMSIKDGVGSISYVPPVCGIKIASFVIQKLLNNQDANSD